MNSLTDQAAKVLAEIDEQLAICEKHIGDENNLRKLAAKYDAEDALSTALTGIPHSDEVQTDLRGFADFIASARTVCPLSLRCLKTAIEGLLEIYKYDSGNGCCDYGCDTPTIAENLLITIITEWNENK